MKNEEKKHKGCKLTLHLRWKRELNFITNKNNHKKRENKVKPTNPLDKQTDQIIFTNKQSAKKEAI